MTMAIPAAPTGPALRSDAEANRQRILAAARELLAERGVGIGLKDIALRAGLGVGTVYRRFPSIDDLFDTLFRESLAELGQHYVDALACPDAWLGFTWYLERSFAMIAKNRGFWILATRGSSRYRGVTPGKELFWRHVPTLIDRAKATGKLRADFGAADVLAIQVALSTVLDFSTDETAGVARRLLGLVLDGIPAQRRAPTSLEADAPSDEQISRAMDAWLYQNSRPRAARDG
jgi:AcrR family transcriptional regulator